MADLRALIESLGHTGVTTYIQSGNVVFTSPARSASALASAIEKQIARDFGLEIRVVLRTKAELAKVIAGNPFAGADLTSPEGRTRAVDLAGPVLREIPSELLREQYIQQVSGRTGFDHKTIKDAVARRNAPRRGPEPEEPAARLREPIRVDRREEDALRWAIHQGELVVDWIDASLFWDPVAREAFEYLWSSDDVPEAIKWGV